MSAPPGRRDTPPAPAQRHFHHGVSFFERTSTLTELILQINIGINARLAETATVVATDRERRGGIGDDRLHCRRRLLLHALAYNLGNFLRTLATPEPIKDWSLTSLKEKLIKIGAKVVSHGRYVAFQMAEVAIPRQMFQEILRLIAELRPQPPPAPA